MKLNRDVKMAKLALETGEIFTCRSFGASGSTRGELVFNTSMTGYQEILTDPSYKGQIVLMTYPLIGNYGVNSGDCESSGPQVQALVVKESSRIASNSLSENSLPGYLIRNNVIAVEGIDTRALTRRVRTRGAMKAVISTIDLDDKVLTKQVNSFPGLIGRDLVGQVSTPEEYSLNPGGNRKLAVIDCGIKSSILKNLAGRGFRLTVFPYLTPAARILAGNPDGVFISNGPGDPAALSGLIATVKQIIGKVPVCGICLGHQILGLALEGKTYKLKFGHHGGNHPVKDLNTGRVLITAQNHGFCVDMDSLKSLKPGIEITHINLNDNTVEGMKHESLKILSVQFHPESSPGPHDAAGIFDEFSEMIKSHKPETADKTKESRTRG